MSVSTATTQGPAKQTDNEGGITADRPGTSKDILESIVHALFSLSLPGRSEGILSSPAAPKNEGSSSHPDQGGLSFTFLS